MTLNYSKITHGYVEYSIYIVITSTVLPECTRTYYCYACDIFQSSINHIICTGAHVLVLMYWCSCTGAHVLVLMYWYSCTCTCIHVLVLQIVVTSAPEVDNYHDSLPVGPETTDIKPHHAQTQFLL